MNNKLFLICNLVISIIFSIYLFVNITPDNPLVSKNFLNYLAPQGFAFYSKSPTEKILKIAPNSPEVYIPNASHKNFFGLSRLGRAQMVELGTTEEVYPTNTWEQCDSEQNCIDKVENSEAKILDHQEYRNLKKGEYIMYYKDITPWYWTDYDSSFNGKVIKVRIK